MTSVHVTVAPFDRIFMTLCDAHIGAWPEAAASDPHVCMVETATQDRAFVCHLPLGVRGTVLAAHVNEKFPRACCAAVEYVGHSFLTCARKFSEQHTYAVPHIVLQAILLQRALSTAADGDHDDSKWRPMGTWSLTNLLDCGVLHDDVRQDSHGVIFLKKESWTERSDMFPSCVASCTPLHTLWDVRQLPHVVPCAEEALQRAMRDDWLWCWCSSIGTSSAACVTLRCRRCMLLHELQHDARSFVAATAGGGFLCLH